MTRLARTTDPDTSHEAAEKIEASGAASKQREAVLDELLHMYRLFGHGHTAVEISVHGGLDRHMVSRRLPEIERAGKIIRGRKRECFISGSSQLTWWPADELTQGRLF